ncbi:SUKH-4 family immunity protein [Streptomyces sp. NPDC003753]
MVINTENWQKIQEWMTSPKRSSNLLLIAGTAGSGKSEFVREAAAEISGSILIDCTGLTADSVARRIVTKLGGDLAPSGRRWRKDILRTTVEGEHVILLSNVQWAGTLVTSSEPLRIARSLASKLIWAPKARIRIALEWDPSILGDPPNGSVSIYLQGPGAPAGGHELLQGVDTAAVQAFHALSLSELTAVGLSVWRLLVMAAFPSRQPPTEADLLRIARDNPEALTVLEDAAGHPGVGFRRPFTGHFRRQQGDARPEQQDRITESLITHIRESNPGRPWTEAGEVGEYAAKTLPVHAALAGSLEQTLSQGWILANCEASSVLEALGTAYPEGVPHGSIAADIRSLEAQGIQPAGQGEWVSWLHHAALSSGRTELARQLVDSGVALPWRTAWSRWRPSGVFGVYDGEVGRVDEIALAVDEAHGQRVVTVRDTTTDKSALPEFSYVMREWEISTGNPVGEEVHVQESLDEAEWLFEDRAPEGQSAVFAVHSPSGWRVEEDGAPPLPRMPASVTSGVFVDGMWILAGSGGLFAVSPGTDLDPNPATWLPEPLVEEHARLAVPEVPLQARAAAGGEPSSRLWFEAGLGEGACHRLAASELPDGVENQAARRFLVDIGLPVVRGFLNLSTDSPSKGGLREVPWPGTAQNRPPSGAGPLFPIGVWMYSRLLLDGATGRVLRDTTRGPNTVLAGSSLSQFFTMVRLFDEHRKAFYPSRADRQDHGRILRQWCSQIDPAALEGEVWDIVLGPYDFEDATWDLVSPDGRFP